MKVGEFWHSGSGHQRPQHIKIWLLEKFT